MRKAVKLPQLTRHFAALSTIDTKRKSFQNNHLRNSDFCFYKAPQVTLLENRCLLDRGMWQVKKLRRRQVVELTPWITLIPLDSALSGPEFVKRDPLDLARLYQSLLDAGLAKCRADVARYFGVSRARVTQVLRRLKSTDDNPEPTKRKG
jgi:hypothetical protein